MPSAFIYLDESGDLGWKFDKPYRNGGSSRFLTIAAVCAPAEKIHVPKRVVKDMYGKFKWTPAKEHKWNGMSPTARKEFAQRANQMCVDHQDITMHAIIVRKQNVMQHIRDDGNKLYNYMIKLALVDCMAKYDVVTMVPDPRSIKVESGKSLHDYLQTELWFTKKAITKLKTEPIDSARCLGLQFTDMLSGAVQMRYEDNEGSFLNAFNNNLKIKLLYF